MYSDTKCFKKSDKFGQQSEAKRICTELDSASTLIEIQSQDEQNFINKFLLNVTKAFEEVWIGLERDNSSYHWKYGEKPSYENWDQNSGKTKDCVAMSLLSTSLGKWRDEVCTRKLVVICQKKLLTKIVLRHDIDKQQEMINNLKNILKQSENNFKKLQETVNAQQETINKQKVILENFKKNQDETVDFQNKEINSMKLDLNKIDSIIPIGFIYTQLPQQSMPKELWPNMEWKEVTSEYAGLFFRAEGGKSAAFGQIQEANQSWISSVDIFGWHYDSFHGPEEMSKVTNLEENKWVETNPEKSLAIMHLNFFTTGGEVRPKNTAIKIWKRIK